MSAGPCGFTGQSSSKISGKSYSQLLLKKQAAGLMEHGMNGGIASLGHSEASMHGLGYLHQRFCVCLHRQWHSGTIDAKATLRCSLSTSGSEFSLHSDSRAGALFCFELVAGRIWAHLSAIARGNAEKFSTLTRVVLQTDNRKKRKKSPN